MRIVQVEDDFHPAAGYQINILSKYLSKFGHDVYIISSEMDKVPAFLKDFFGAEDIDKKDADYSHKYNVKIIRIPVRCFVGTRAIFTSECFRTIQAIHPEVLFVHGNDTFTGIQLLLKRNKLQCGFITDSHMLKMASRNKLSGLFHLWYRFFITPVIKREHITVIRTQDDNFVYSELGIPLELAPWISYGSDSTIFHPDVSERQRFRKNNAIPDEVFLVAYVGKLDENKNGLFLAEAIKKRFLAGRQIWFIIVGNPSGEYGKKVIETLNRSENHVLQFPTQAYNDLPQYFQAADLVVFPKQCSLSFYDAQSCGIPVLSEDNNINVERCNHGNGRNFSADNIESFRDRIMEMAQMEQMEWQKMSDNAINYIRNNFDYEKKAREYEELIIQAAEKFRAGRTQ